MSYLVVVVLSCVAAFTLVAATLPDASAGIGRGHAAAHCHVATAGDPACDRRPDTRAAIRRGDPFATLKATHGDPHDAHP